MLHTDRPGDDALAHLLDGLPKCDCPPAGASANGATFTLVTDPTKAPPEGTCEHCGRVTFTIVIDYARPPLPDWSNR